MTSDQKSCADVKDQLFAELRSGARRHRIRGAIDAGLHQGLIILAAFAGLGALAAGLYWRSDAVLAGILGAVPSLASILIRQLHCVKAANWHRRKAVQLDGLLHILKYELPSTPTPRQIATLSQELRDIEKRFVDEWEVVTKADESHLSELTSKPVSPQGAYNSTKEQAGTLPAVGDESALTAPKREDVQ